MVFFWGGVDIQFVRVCFLGDAPRPKKNKTKRIPHQLRTPDSAQTQLAPHSARQRPLHGACLPQRRSLQEPLRQQRAVLGVPGASMGSWAPEALPQHLGRACNRVSEPCPPKAADSRETNEGVVWSASLVCFCWWFGHGGLIGSVGVVPIYPGLEPPDTGYLI